MNSNLNLDAVRRSLENEYLLLSQRLAESTGTKETGRNPDRDDLAHAYTSLERNLALLSIEREQLAQIEMALRRLDEGVYGNCVECGAAIAPERLQALPYATLCVSCQAQAERRC